MGTTRINPAELHATAGYHHVTIADAGRTAHLAGQCPVTRDGTVVEGLDGQIDQVVANALAALAAAGAEPGDVVRAVVYVVSADSRELATVWRRLNETALAPALTSASTLLGVAALGYPGQRLEIDLTAALPDR
jgi:enamine deaminase RidA (YjgF/YER057c/UK114 family)